MGRASIQSATAGNVWCPCELAPVKIGFAWAKKQRTAQAADAEVRARSTAVINRSRSRSDYQPERGLKVEQQGGGHATLTATYLLSNGLG
jgi:hypothetical protein